MGAEAQESLEATAASGSAFETRVNSDETISSSEGSSHNLKNGDVQVVTEGALAQNSLKAARAENYAEVSVAGNGRSAKQSHGYALETTAVKPAPSGQSIAEEKSTAEDKFTEEKLEHGKKFKRSLETEKDEKQVVSLSIHTKLTNEMNAKSRAEINYLKGMVEIERKSVQKAVRFNEKVEGTESWYE